MKNTAFLNNVPVYNEPDVTIFKTVDGMAKLLRIYPGVALNMVTDDFMWAEKDGVRRCSAEQRRRRRRYYRRNGIICVHRPAIGRPGRYASAPLPAVPSLPVTSAAACDAASRKLAIAIVASTSWSLCSSASRRASCRAKR